MHILAVKSDFPCSVSKYSQQRFSSLFPTIR